MSKIGKKNILLPKETSIKIEGDKITITGPKGNKSLFISEKIFSSKVNEKNEFQIIPVNKEIDHKTQLLWGTYRSLINNAVIGVSSGHEKILELNGVGFRANLKGETLNLQIGFSHDVNFTGMNRELNNGMQVHMAGGSSALLSLQLEDWLEMDKPVNIPGTFDEYPNWRRKLTENIESMFERHDINELASKLTHARKQASQG